MVKLKINDIEKILNYLLETEEMVYYDLISDQLIVSTINGISDKIMNNILIFGDPYLELIGEF